MRSIFRFLKTYPYLTGLVLSVIVAVFLYAAGMFDAAVRALDGFGYASSFAVGMMYAFTFTAAFASGFFLELGEHMNPFFVAVLGGLGAMVMDLFLYWVARNRIKEEVYAALVALVPGKRLKRMEQFTKRRVFFWFMPFMASLLIASPLPDELGVAIFGFINFRPKYLSLLSFLLNFAGIFALVFLGFAIGQA